MFNMFNRTTTPSSTYFEDSKIKNEKIQVEFYTSQTILNTFQLRKDLQL
jgi:hypothetical protein